MTAVFAVTSAVLGAVVGSFLNACIHRMPRGISLLNPRRSFCPSCGKLIPWYENLPMISWLMLRGKCSGCGAKISARYLLVELVTAVLFCVLLQRFGFPLAVSYWIFFSLLLAATFIDIEHFIIPDEITWGGTAAGLVLSALLPVMMDADSHLTSFLLALGGAALGFVLLWLVVEGGKLAFGKKRLTLTSAEPFEWVRDGDRADLKVGEDSLTWEEIFGREKDQLVLHCDGAVSIDGREVQTADLKFFYNRVEAGGETVELDSILRITGRVTGLVIPREAMGFGDVKFIACIGAFLGWQAVLFAIFASSIIGCIAGLAGIFLAKDRSGARIPFGPFLALGAALWLFGGRELTYWYFNRLPLLIGP